MFLVYFDYIKDEKQIMLANTSLNSMIFTMTLQYDIAQNDGNDFVDHHFSIHMYT